MSTANRLGDLGSLVQRKGAAARPAEIPQRGDPTPAPPKPAAPEPAAEKEKKVSTKSLTLKLTDAEYEELRRFAFDRRLTHQTVMKDALLRHLRGKDA